MRELIILCLISVTLSSCAVFSIVRNVNNSVSPVDFGLNEAKNGEERFWVLYNTHLAAIALGKNVSYTGIGTISIDIPGDAKSIPLTKYNDFSGLELTVQNNGCDFFFLFVYENQSYPITVSKKEIDSGLLKNYKELKRGRHLLYVKDNKPWVEQREGYMYGHFRKDLLLVEKGKAYNKVVMPYDNQYSAPECRYFNIGKDSLTIKNLSFIRTRESLNKTFLCNISGYDNVALTDISIYTPENNKENDQIITISNCTNVKIHNLKIEGTYSREDYSGYGIALDNVWNFSVDKMYGHANWGIFGNNNVNLSRITNSDINRYDIHCYGKDVFFENVIFRNNYNQFSSVYGTISFNNCSFIDFIPIINGASYNSYVGYDLVFNDCYYSSKDDTPIIIDESYIDNSPQSRPELKKRCLPNVTIKNMTIDIPKTAPNVYLFYIRDRGRGLPDVDYLSKITLEQIDIRIKDSRESSPAGFINTNLEINTINKVEVVEKIGPINKTDGGHIKRRIVNNLFKVEM